MARDAWRTRLFGLAAVVAVPLLVLGGLELTLRIAGVGYAPGFFVGRQIENESVLTDNPRFGWRFFPKAVARAPQPFSIPREKGEGTVRVCVLGGSAAMGDPAPAIGIPRHLQAMLEAARPDLDIEVVNAAMTAINSHVVLPIARDCVSHGADVLVAYLGNNEVVGPFGAGSVFGIPGAGLVVSRANIFAKSTRIGQLADGAIGALARGGRSPEAWRGMEAFLGTRLPHSDPRLAVVHGSFRRNLEDVRRAAAGAGVPLVLSSVAVNMRSCAPFGSQHRAGLTESDLGAWERAFEAGRAHEEAGEIEEALRRYETAAAIDDDWAELSFRAGRCLLAAGRPDEAAVRFRRAVELDVLRFRADEGIQDALREVAAADGVRFVDAAAALAAASPSGLAGHEHFDDHVHLNPDGNWIVGRALAEAVLPLLPRASDHPDAAGRIPDPEACRTRLGFAAADRRTTLETMRGRRARAPFAGQPDADEWKERLDAELDRLEVFTQPHHRRRALTSVREQVQRHPRDPELRRALAALLAETGNLGAALEERQRLRRRFPHWAEAYYAEGDVLRRSGRSEEAILRFRECVKLSPVHFLARHQLGELLVEAGRTEEAVPQFEAALRSHPDGAIAYRSLGDAWLRLGKPEKALVPLTKAAEINPELAAVHKKRGDALAAMGRRPEAAAAYREALRINPDYAAARERLGALPGVP